MLLHDWSPAATTRRVSDAITSALAHVAAVTAGAATDHDGAGLLVATRHARACGATHGQIVAAMSCEPPCCPTCGDEMRRMADVHDEMVWACWDTECQEVAHG